MLFLALVLYLWMLLHIVEKVIIVGHLLLRGIMKIKGLQGTMINGEAMVTGEVLTLIVIIIGTTALHDINQMEQEICSYLEWQLNVILQHYTTFKLTSNMISPDLGLIHPWFSLNMIISLLFVSMAIVLLPLCS